jgi:hypothetical protein
VDLNVIANQRTSDADIRPDRRMRTNLDTRSNGGTWSDYCPFPDGCALAYKSTGRNLCAFMDRWFWPVREPAFERIQGFTRHFMAVPGMLNDQGDHPRR